jgi:hypothetical protein
MVVTVSVAGGLRSFASGGAVAVVSLLECLLVSFSEAGGLRTFESLHGGEPNTILKLVFFT